MLIPALVTAATVLVVVVLLRLVTSQAARPVYVLASGNLPAADKWVEPALTKTAPLVDGFASWADDEDGGQLNGHQGELVADDGDTQLVVTLQPHPVLSTIERSQPLRVTISLGAFRPRSGVRRLIVGKAVSSKTLKLRRRLQQAIQSEVRSAGGVARTTNRFSTGPAAILGLIVVVLVMAVLLGPPVVSRINAALTPPAPAPHKQPPASAKMCKPVGSTAGEPTRSAAVLQKRCRLAESTRAAYLAQAERTAKVKLTRVRDPATEKDYTMVCSGTDLVTCDTGKTRVFLFTPM